MLPIKSLQMLMSNENLEVSSPSPSNQIDYSKHPGVRATKSGKWGAAIRHPITKASVWLGSYNTPKEAANAFMKRKMEYQLLAVVHKTQDSGIQGVKYESVSLVTCNSAADYATIEETEDALNRNSCMDHAEMNFKESKTEVEEDVIAHSSAIRAKRLPGSGSICQKRSGRWEARIGYKKSKFHVGNYSTYEEADAALKKKRQELESVAYVEAVANEPVNGELICSDQTPEKQVSISSTYEEAEMAIDKRRQDLDSVDNAEMVAEEDRTTTTSKESMALVACNEDPENQISFIRPRGVFKRKSGRWFAEIKNPVTKWRGSVGTYDTAEEAFEVLNRKRREFALLKNAEKKCKQTIEAAEEDLHGRITNCKVELIEWKGDESAVATKSKDIESGDCRGRVDDVQAPCLAFVSNEEFDMSVVNAYGELVGEFSRLDDDLWLVESLDDV